MSVAQTANKQNCSRQCLYNSSVTSQSNTKAQRGRGGGGGGREKQTETQTEAETQSVKHRQKHIQKNTVRDVFGMQGL